jgi:transporter family protein
MWVFLALGAAFLASFSPIINKRLLVNVDVPLVAWAGQTAALPLLGLGLMLFFQPLPRVDKFFFIGIVGSGALNALAHLAFTRALKEADASLVAPFAVFSPVFTLLIAIVSLGEIPSLRGGLGVAIIVFGAYLINLKSGAGALEPLRELFVNRGINLALLSSFLWGLTPIFEKTAIQHTVPVNPPAAAFGSGVLLSGLLFPVMMIRASQPTTQVLKHWRGFLLLGLMGGVAPIMGYTAFSLGLVGYVSALFKLSTVLTLAWAFFFLGERDVIQRLPGAMTMLTGGVLIAS